VSSGANIDTVDSTSITLHCASLKNNPRGIAEILLAVGAEVNARSPGTVAAESPFISMSCLQDYLALATTARHFAAVARNDLDMMKLLLEYEARRYGGQMGLA
jgi:ankyrin repeat protein